MTPTATQTNTFRWLIDPKRSHLGYWLIYALGAVQVIGAGAIFWHSGQPIEVLLGVALLLFGLLFLSVARMLGQAKGGVGYDPSAKRITLFGANAADRFDISTDEVIGLRVDRRQEYWGKTNEPTLVSSLCVILEGNVGVLLLEHVLYDEIIESARLVQQATGFPLLEENEPSEETTGEVSVSSGATNRAMEFHTGPTWGLSVTMALLALVSLFSGVMLFLGVSVTGVLGFLFGPVFLFLGLAVGGLWVFKALAFEEVNVGTGKLEQSYRLGTRRFLQRSFVLGDKRFVRLRTRGSLGFSLEVISEGKMLILGSGTSSHGRTSPRRLLEAGRVIAGS